MWILVEYTTYSFLQNIFSRKYKEKILQYFRESCTDFKGTLDLIFSFLKPLHLNDTLEKLFVQRLTDFKVKNRIANRNRWRPRIKGSCFFLFEWIFIKCPNYRHISDQRNLKTKSWFFVWQFERLLRLRSLLLTLVLWIRYLLCLTVCHVNWM